MEMLGKIRRMYFRDKLSLHQIAKRTGLSRNTILESSGRDNVKFTTGTKKMLIMGKLGVLVTAALATYQVLDAENKPKEAARQGIIVGAGALGGILAGMGASTLCGPAMPICAIAVVLAGTVAGGVAGEAVASSLDEELEEFTHWDIF